MKAVSECFALSKDCGFKIVAHMMPDLPNVGWERDLAQFKEYFENPAFRSDGLKIYPTLVIRGTGLYELWKARKYQNYPPDTLIELLAQVLAFGPSLDPYISNTNETFPCHWLPPVLSTEI